MLCLNVKRHVEGNVTERRRDTLAWLSNLCSVSTTKCLVLAVLCAIGRGLRETQCDATSPDFPVNHDATSSKCRSSWRCLFALRRVIIRAIFLDSLCYNRRLFSLSEVHKKLVSAKIKQWAVSLRLHVFFTIQHIAYQGVDLLFYYALVSSLVFFFLKTSQRVWP